MRRRGARARWLVIWGLAIGALAGLSGAAPPATGEPAVNPKERIDFWMQNYTALAAQDDARVGRAQQIFDRLLKAAGRRPNVEPRLYLIKEDPVGLSLPIAIPDGWIIVSRRVLDLCYQRATHGDDRLAFVLAHELAHQLDDDFWHMKFFQAIASARANDRAPARVLSELKQVVHDSDKALAKELRADEQGIVYVAMAGFDPAAVVPAHDDTGFFREWIGLRDPARITNPSGASTHPDAAQRAAAVRSRLQQIVEQSGLFELGLLYYDAGDFRRAMLAFKEYRRYFPGREVTHDLAVSNHQLALSHYHPTDGRPLFKLPLSIDPVTRGASSAYRSAADAAQAFQQYIAKAIEYYQMTIWQDPRYLPAYRNLAAAHLARNEPFKAIAVLEDALQLAPGDAEVHNALGVAFSLAHDTARATRHFERALAAAPQYTDPLYNLAVTEPDAARAAGYARRYLKSDATSGWAVLVAKRFRLPVPEARPAVAGRDDAGPERLANLEIGAYVDEVPAGWGAPQVRTFTLEQSQYRLARYPNGALVVAQGDEIRILAAMPQYAGKTRRGIGVGSPQREVIARYGPPPRVLSTTRGESLVYPERGLAFRVEGQRVRSWLAFWE